MPFVVFFVGFILVVIIGTIMEMAKSSNRNTCGNTDKANALIKEANYHVDAGNIDEALKCLNSALEYDSGNPEAYYMVGLFCVSYGKVARSKEILGYLKTINSPLANDLAYEIDAYTRKYGESGNYSTSNSSQKELNRYYEILEVEIGVSKAKIKQAYKDMVRVWHPDRFEYDKTLRNKAEAKIKLINEAYQRLMAV